MPDFAAFFASGQVADLMVAVLLLEALALLGFWWLTGRGLAPRSVFALVLPGVFFALALRAALTGACSMPISPAFKRRDTSPMIQLLANLGCPQALAVASK